MPELDTIQTTPLQNLFYYIRDIYNTSEPCFDFENETSNSKKENENYWKVAKLISIAKQCEQKKINDFSFAVGTGINSVDYILKVKRIPIPAEPKIPLEISEWTLLDRSANVPTVTFKKEIEVVERFDQSAQRIKDLDKYKQQSQSALFTLTVPSSLNGWVKLSDNKILRTNERKISVSFTENENRTKTANKFKKEFNEYHTKYETPLKTNNIYDALHGLHYELKGKDTKRLYISFGLVCGRIGDQNYRNFLFNVPLKLSLKSQEITLETDTFSRKIFTEQYFVELLNAHFKYEHTTIVEQRKREVILLIDNFNSKPKEFSFDIDFIRSEFYSKGLEMIGVFAKKKVAFFKNEELNYDFENAPIANEITFSFSPIIQTKLVESQIAISKDANNIINKINELQSSGLLHQIPAFFKKLFLIEGQEIDLKHDTEYNKYSSETNKHSVDLSEKDHRSLFPLAYNDEQFEIAKRLNEQDAVTVKGPPGTGKSHTIANLISHFVAQGKSILVVSHNAKALSVLRDKLPRSIQDLAVSLVNEGKGNESLKGSVNAIIHHLAQRYDKSKVTELEIQLTNVEKRYADTLDQIYKVVQANSESYKVLNPLSNRIEEKTAYEWAAFYSKLSSYRTELIKEPIAHNADTNGLSEKLVLLASIGNNLTEDDFELINFQFLSDDKFLELTELRKIETQLTDIHERINVGDYIAIQPNIQTEKLTLAIADFEAHYEKFKTLSIPGIIYKHVSYNVGILKNVLSRNRSLRDQIESAEDKLLSFQLDLSSIEDTDPDILHQQINQLILKFGENKSIGWLTKSLLDKSLKRFFDCKVNYMSANEIDHFKIIETEITRRKCLKQLSITLNNYLNTFGIPNPIKIIEVLKELDFTVFFAERVTVFNNEMTDIGLAAVSINSPDLTSQLTFIKNIKHYFKYKEIVNYLNETKRKLNAYSEAHYLINKIADAIENVDRASYELYLNEYKTRRDKVGRSLEFDRLFKETSNILPLTTDAIKRLCLGSASFILNKDVCETDIFHLKINDFLTAVTNGTKGSDKLLTDLETIKRSIEKQTADIIAYKTWYHKSKNVSDTQKAALNAWLNDLINIGKGYGQNTARNIASAITNMQIAKGAVPIWIMPQETAVTFFPDASPGQFDLLIIDEASQCDISSLNLIFRCKKSLVVGDENQTSVVVDRSIFTIKRTNEMLDKYLISHRFKTQFDVNNKNNSIYTISGVIYPNIVTLTEHFRCLPDIIGYSNRYVYNFDIVPLRTPTQKIFGAPVAIHYVEDNYLDEQKPLIVKEVIGQIERYIVDFQEERLKTLPTIGILTLDSSNTRHQTLLIRQISQNELIKQFEDKLELLIGTSREFQGDERDIMFMTITASHSFKEDDNVEIKPPRSAATEEYMRIFNVAASRAKDKSIVIHSIHPDAVSIMNPDCYRKKLIDYYTNIQNKTNKQTTVKNLQTLLNKTDANSGDF